MLESIGLVLGKFAPFHFGHKYVIDTAIGEMDKVIVMVYEDDIINIPLHIRSNWIRNIYKEQSEKIEVIDCYNCPQVVGYTKEITDMHDNYILKILNGRTITHFYSSEPYGDHVSKALDAIDRRVDLSREKVKISATQIRENAYKHRKYIPEIVYKDLIIKIVFLGSESTGKTTITKKLAEEYNTNFMPEYGAEYWLQHQKNMMLEPYQMVEIARGHIAREDNIILNSNKYCFIDTNAITTYMFAKDYHEYVLLELCQLADNCYKRYDLVFLCEDDIPYDNTWDRRGLENRTIFQKKIIGDLLERKIPFIRLSGSLDERVMRVKSALSIFKKYSNILTMRQCENDLR